MAIVNTGAVERTITGVNESEVNSQATIMNLIENSTSGNYGNNPASEILVEAPDGTISAVMPTPDSNSDRFEYLIDGGTYPTDTKLVYSWYRKRVTTPAVTTYTGDLRVVSLSNMTNVGSVTQIETDYNGFDRFQAVVNITNGSLLSKVRGYFGYSVGTGNSSVAYWGHQLETGAEARAYAPTNGTALFIDNNSTSVVNNTGVTERAIEGKHDANFVHPLGDELVSETTNNLNGWIDARNNTTLSVVGNNIRATRLSEYAATIGISSTGFATVIGKTYEVKIIAIKNNSSGSIYARISNNSQITAPIFNEQNLTDSISVNSTFIATATETFIGVLATAQGGGNYIQSNTMSVKEVLVNRESTVNNTGTVERGVTGVNESDEMFPDNTNSTIINL